MQCYYFLGVRAFPIDVDFYMAVCTNSLLFMSRSDQLASPGRLVPRFPHNTVPKSIQVACGPQVARYGTIASGPQFLFSQTAMLPKAILILFLSDDAELAAGLGFAIVVSAVEEANLAATWPGLKISNYLAQLQCDSVRFTGYCVGTIYWVLASSL